MSQNYFEQFFHWKFQTNFVATNKKDQKIKKSNKRTNKQTKKRGQKINADQTQEGHGELIEKRLIKTQLIWSDFWLKKLKADL